MTHQGGDRLSNGPSSAVGASVGASPVQRVATGPGKQTLVEQALAPGDAVQLRGTPGEAGDSSGVHAAAARGLGGSGGQLPYLDQIQRSFGRHDVGGVSAHVGGPANQACQDMGAEAYATGSSVAFAGSPGLHTTAHEAAHVVQQRGGVQLKGGVGEANDHYEQHADAVADLVVQGKSAESTLDRLSGGGAGGGSTAVQKFGSREHQSLGDNATGGASYDLGGHSTAIDTSAYNRAFRLTHGDIVMLSGDFFSPRDTRPVAGGGVEPDPDSLFLLAGIPSVSPGQNAGTWDEVVYAIKKAIPTDPRFNPICTPELPEGHPWSRVTFSKAVTDAVDARYLRRAAANDEHFVAPTGTDRGPGAGDGVSAGGSYRALHEAAILMAYDQGNASMGSAREAAAQHFLTDHFAAGHLRTPRGSIRAHWHAIYPNFWTNIRNKIALDVATWINDNDAIGNVASVDQIYLTVQTTVATETASLPPIGFDDLVSLVTHDYDNENGVWVVNDLGDSWKLFGDGNLDNPDPANRTREICEQAVAAGVSDIQAAARLGANKGPTPLAGAALFDAVRGATSGRPQPDAVKYGAEQLLPHPDDSHAADNGTQNWQRANVDELWAAPVRSGATETYGSAITASMASGELSQTLAGMADKFPEAQDTHGVFTVHPRRGFREGFLAPLQSNPRQGLLRIINFTPSAGQAGHNEDDAVMREVNGGEGAAPATAEEMSGLTLEQRADRIRVLIGGYTGEDEGAVVVRLFETARPGDRRALYQMIEGHAWEGEFRDGVFTIDDDLVDALTYPQLDQIKNLIGP